PNQSALAAPDPKIKCVSQTTGCNWPAEQSPCPRKGHIPGGPVKALLDTRLAVRRTAPCERHDAATCPRGNRCEYGVKPGYLPSPGSPPSAAGLRGFHRYCECYSSQWNPLPGITPGFSIF